MSYPGSTDLDPKVQQRILTAFGEAVRLHQDGMAEESLTILRSILEVDARFVPAQRLSSALTTGEKIDLGQLYGDLADDQAIDVESTLEQARQALASRDLEGALVLAQAVLRELPGHVAAKQIVVEARAFVETSDLVTQQLAKADHALDSGDVEAAREATEEARRLDPSHPELGELEGRLNLAAQDFEVEAREGTSDSDDAEELEDYTFAEGPELPPTPQPTPPQTAPQEAVPGPPSFAGPSAASPSFGSAPGPWVSTKDDAAASASQAEAGSESTGADQGGEAPAPVFAEPEPSGGRPDEEKLARIDSLLEEGQSAFDRGEYQTAMDGWARVYLIDPGHREAEARIELARQRLEEQERLVEHRFYDAREAFEQGRLDEARELCREILALRPQHLEAHDLLASLQTPAAPPPPPPPPAEEVDLFHDEFVPARASSPTVVARRQPPETPARPARRALPALDLVKKLPLPIVGGVAGVLILLVVVALVMVRGRVFSPDGSAVTQAVEEAERLAGGGRLQEAITLLRSLEVEGEQANQVNVKILEYQRKLKAKPAPPKVEFTAEISEALQAGKRLKALALIRKGLDKVPGDQELLQLQGEITTYSAAIPGLLDAVEARKWQPARQLAGQVQAEHRDDPEARNAWEAATFNLALGLLRTYQVAGAHGLLDELSRVAPDAEVERMRELASSYLSRPVDPRYEIFLRNISERPIPIE